MSEPKENISFHTLPILLLAVIGVLVSVPIVFNNHRPLGVSTFSGVDKDLTSRVLDIQPQTNGLAVVNLRSVQVAEPAAAAQQVNLSQFEQSLSLSLALRNAADSLK